MKKKEFETFSNLSQQQVENLIDEKPSCFNQQVNVRKLRITIEEIEEPIEIIQERLQSLWDYSDNLHHSDPLRQSAKKYNYELKGARGNKLSRKWERDKK